MGVRGGVRECSPLPMFSSYWAYGQTSSPSLLCHYMWPYDWVLTNGMWAVVLTMPFPGLVYKAIPQWFSLFFHLLVGCKRTNRPFQISWRFQSHKMKGIWSLSAWSRTHNWEFGGDHFSTSIPYLNTRSMVQDEIARSERRKGPMLPDDPTKPILGGSPLVIPTLPIPP